ncbi:MAG: hypothetical protein ACFE96_00410 [Candidatus Hermodarchaeota archaeon]
MIVVPIILVGYLVIWLIFKGLERTFTGRIIIGVLVIGLGIFIVIILEFLLLAGILAIVFGIIFIIIEVIKQEKQTALKD